MYELACGASLPANEAERQAAVEGSRVLERGGDAALQRIVDRAARVFEAPIAAISIIDRNRQWFAARVGLKPEETDRSSSFCAHAIHRPGEPLIVPDACKDERFVHNPLVEGAPHIRFYAGVPLIGQSGYALGALCVIDTEPRERADKIYDLQMLALEVERVLARPDG
ncbi:GAF domain-containing protein [Sphingomonas sp. ID0503]|uniref:GAF domain-containing protein n=1 Tax=Sphingomonas sp. ID0503 TaxID=3399691 RepID=UPI003AFB72A0